MLLVVVLKKDPIYQIELREGRQQRKVTDTERNVWFSYGQHGTISQYHQHNCCRKRENRISLSEREKKRAFAPPFYFSLVLFLCDITLVAKKHFLCVFQNTKVLKEREREVYKNVKSERGIVYVAVLFVLLTNSRRLFPSRSLHGAW